MGLAAIDRGRPAFATHSFDWCVYLRCGERASPRLVNDSGDNRRTRRKSWRDPAGGESRRCEFDPWSEIQMKPPSRFSCAKSMVAVPQFSEDSIREQIIGQGTVYRVAVEGQPPSENLSVPLDSLVRSREYVCSHQKRRQPAAADFCRPRRAASGLSCFSLPATGHIYHLLTGNDHCAAPNYKTWLRWE